MSNAFKVKNIKDTNTIMNAVMDGATEFEIKEDDLKACISKYGLKLEDLDQINDLITKGNFSDWYKATEDKSLPDSLRNSMRKMVNEFSNKINNLRKTNPKLHKDMMTFIGPDFTDNVNDEFIKNFELPTISDGVEDTVYGE